MIDQKGFTVIELLIYIISTVIIVSGTLFFIVQIIKNSAEIGARLNSTTKISITLDALERELSVAPPHCTFWKKIEPCCLDWESEGQNICWFFQGGTLFRSERTFDAFVGQWSKKRTAVIAKNISDVRFDPIYIERKKKQTTKTVSSVVCLIEYFLINETTKIKRTIFLKKRFVRLAL